VPERLQHACTPEILAADVLHWLRDQAAAGALESAFLAIHDELAHDASARAAEAILELAGTGQRAHD